MKSNTKTITVSQLNRYVAAVLANQEPLKALLVQGELSNVKHYPSGHWYFNLKDQNTQVSCVMFRGQAASLKFEPKNGLSVLAGCRASLYERDGKFQLYVDSLEPLGKGDLHLAFEQLNEKLKREGLYDPAHKKALPRFPKRIGIATASTGAVIRDIITVSQRRFPACRLLLVPCKVQGEGAAASIVSAIQRLDAMPDIDLIIVGRGGGSMEDLWCFNEEIVARAVFQAQKPIISAVGHETDFTICDFVADLRAPTPSAAAELALPDQREIQTKLKGTNELLAQLLQQKIQVAAHRLQRLVENPYLANPYERINNRRQYLDALEEEVRGGFGHYLEKQNEALASLAGRLDALSPLKVLGRGYAMVTSEVDEKPIISVKDLKEQQRLRLYLRDGRVLCQLLESEESHGRSES